MHAYTIGYVHAIELVRIPPFSLVSPGCCTLVCTPTGVYKKEGGPCISHNFAFSKNIVDNTCIWRWKHYLHSYQEFYQKKVLTKCYTDQGYENNIVRLRFDYF